jgi:hypothetical protein
MHVVERRVRFPGEVWVRFCAINFRKTWLAIHDAVEFM